MQIYLAISILIGVLIYREIMHLLDRRAHIKRENDLLNRFYSRDFGEYVSGTKTLEIKPDPRDIIDEMEGETDGLSVV